MGGNGMGWRVSMNGNLMKVDEKKGGLSKGKKQQKEEEWLMSISNDVFLFLVSMWFLL